MNFVARNVGVGDFGRALTGRDPLRKAAVSSGEPGARLGARKGDYRRREVLARGNGDSYSLGFLSILYSNLAEVAVTRTDRRDRNNREDPSTIRVIAVLVAASGVLIIKGLFIGGSLALIALSVAVFVCPLIAYFIFKGFQRRDR